MANILIQVEARAGLDQKRVYLEPVAPFLMIGSKFYPLLLSFPSHDL